MKKIKKVLISLVAGLLATAPVATLAITTNQVHAVETTEKTPSFDEGVLKLNHKTRVYNKKGKKNILILSVTAYLRMARKLSISEQLKQ